MLIENFRPGVMEAWGLDYASLAADNPALIYVSISGYGQTGEWRGPSRLRAVRARRGRLPRHRGAAASAAGRARPDVDRRPRRRPRTRPSPCSPRCCSGDAPARASTSTSRWPTRSCTSTSSPPSLLTPGTRSPKSGSTPQAIFTTSDGGVFSAGNPVSGEVFATLCRSFGCPELIDDERFIDSGGPPPAARRGDRRAAGRADRARRHRRGRGRAQRRRPGRRPDPPRRRRAGRRRGPSNATPSSRSPSTAPTTSRCPARRGASPARRPASPTALGAFGADNDAVLERAARLDADEIAGLARAACCAGARTDDGARLVSDRRSAPTSRRG